MKVALTGASGHLGSALMRELYSRDIPVKALFRGEDNRCCEGLPVEMVKGNLLDSDAMDSLMQGCDIAIHCAALISINGDPGGLVHQTNVEGTKLAIDTAQRAGIKRFIHISSIHAFQQHPATQVLDEKRAFVTENAFAYDRSKRAGQEIALAASSSNMQVLVINPTSIIGPYDFKPSLMGKVIIDLYHGRLPFIFNGGFDFCDCRDVANAIVNAATMGNAGESYLLAGKWHSLKELAGYLSLATSKTIKPVALPPVAGWMGLPFIKLLATMQNKEPLYTREALEALFTGNRYISSDKARSALGYSIRPFQETLHDTFHWFNNNGYLNRELTR